MTVVANQKAAWERPRPQRTSARAVLGGYDHVVIMLIRRRGLVVETRHQRRKLRAAPHAQSIAGERRG
ncbi:MAG: hypothetical protein WBP81_13430, partial [Solirubrobacteraceae bacterium]